ncbi:hypothetical protein D9757_000643 [Collybiopsis confluens]|uniref:Uncharacterized protein n=1 Tax=Collybiopsis confluens TaxID=2823264 RepID=A0A8H5I1A8_9AGAR|nr:hypothetical protein D9757_000643 [Collybiopsis confluens]
MLYIQRFLYCQIPSASPQRYLPATNLFIPFCDTTTVKHSLLSIIAMFTPPDYTDQSLFPPAAFAPSNQLDAFALQMMQKFMADSYVEGRKYWAAGVDDGPNESQVEVEKFLEFTGLLPKRERPIAEPRPVLLNSSDSGTQSLEARTEAIATTPKPRWKRRLSLPSGPPPAFLKPPRLRMRSLSLPLLNKLPRPTFPLTKRLQRLSKNLTLPPLRRTVSEPTDLQSRPSGLSSSKKKPRRMTLDESQMTITTNRDTSASPSPILALPVQSPRLPCDYLPLILSSPRHRPRPVDMRPLTFDREPPPGSPLSVRKVPLPPPEWFDTPFPTRAAEQQPSEEEDDNRYDLQWYKVLFLPFGLFILLLVGTLILVLFIFMEIILSPLSLYCTLCESSATE